MANHTEENLRKIESPTVDNVTGELQLITLQLITLLERRKKNFHPFVGIQNFANE